MSMEQAYYTNNNYYVSLGRRLKQKSEELRNTVSLNTKHDSSEMYDKEPNSESIKAFKMKLIYPNKIVARGANKSVLEVMQHKERKNSSIYYYRLACIY